MCDLMSATKIIIDCDEMTEIIEYQIDSPRKNHLKFHELNKPYLKIKDLFVDF